jgi:hypothetical protein
MQAVERGFMLTVKIQGQLYQLADSLLLHRLDDHKLTTNLFYC